MEPHPDLGNKEQISTDGGRASVWSLDGSDLFYHDLSGLHMMVVAISTDPTPTLGAPTIAFEGPY